MAHPNVRDRVELGRLVEEQAALRRVATLVARGAPPAEVFEAVVTEIGQLVPGANAAALSRYETNDALTMIGKWSKTDGYRQRERISDNDQPEQEGRYETTDPSSHAHQHVRGATDDRSHRSIPQKTNILIERSSS